MRLTYAITLFIHLKNMISTRRWDIIGIYNLNKSSWLNLFVVSFNNGSTRRYNQQSQRRTIIKLQPRSSAGLMLVTVIMISSSQVEQVRCAALCLQFLILYNYILIQFILTLNFRSPVYSSYVSFLASFNKKVLENNPVFLLSIIISKDSKKI